VVWITPIITRSKEGVVVPELGAGGGGGDIHLASELEVSNIGSVSEFEEVCKQIVKEPTNLRWLLSRIDSARSSKDLRMSLAGMDLDNEEEITLQEFAKRLVGLENFISITGNERIPNKPCSHGSPLKDTVHFPFSRHSSYDELCGLVAALKPGDIYPCTVEEDTWTEDVSMQRLFGHLCSGAVFHHDGEMRFLRHQRLENEQPSKKRPKRRNVDDSQESPSVPNTSQEYDTAPEPDKQSQSQIANGKSPKPENVPVVSEEEVPDQCESMPPQIVAIKAAFESYMARTAEGYSLSSSAGEDTEIYQSARSPIVKPASDSQISVSQSAFDSPSQDVVLNSGMQLDGAGDDIPARTAKVDVFSAFNSSSDSHGRRNYREQAYRAAKLTLQTSDSGAWDDLGIRSMGNDGHCKPEEEL
jgi:DNA cross-link repair 1C protein